MKGLGFEVQRGGVQSAIHRSRRSSDTMPSWATLVRSSCSASHSHCLTA